MGISILIAGIFLYLALRGLDWMTFLATLSHANYQFLPIMLIWGSGIGVLRALRWRILLTAEKEIPIGNVFWANMAGYLGNNILPARAGELIRSVYVSRENGLSATFALATGLVERFVDLVALVVLGSSSLSVTKIASEPLQNTLRTISGITLIGTILLLIVPYFGNTFKPLLEKLPMLNAPAEEKISGFLNKFLSGIEALHHPKRAIKFILATCLIWLMDAIGIVLLAYTLHMTFAMPQAFVLLASLGIASAIPSTPGYLGVYQFVAMVVLLPFGISNANALAFIVFLQIVNLLIVIFWGGIAIWRASLFGKSSA